MAPATIKQKGRSMLTENKMTKKHIPISYYCIPLFAGILWNSSFAATYNSSIHRDINDSTSVVINGPLWTDSSSGGHNISISSSNGDISVNTNLGAGAVTAVTGSITLQARTNDAENPEALITIINSCSEKIYNPTDYSLETCGIFARSKKTVDVKSNLQLTSGFHGIYSFDGSVILNGNSKIVATTNSSSVGITVKKSTETGASSSVDIKGDLEIHSNSTGLYALGGNIYIGSNDVATPTKTIMRSGQNGTNETAIWASYTEYPPYPPRGDGGKITGKSIFDIKGNLAVGGYSSTIDLDFLNGSKWEGVARTAINGICNLKLYGTEWNMTSNSTLTNLLIDSFSTINFLEMYSTISIMENGSVSLAQGASIILDQDYSAGDIVKLFILGNNVVWDNGADFQNVQLVSTDQSFYYDYTDNKDGSFTIGLKHLLIPEPTTATLSLLGFISIISRRRKD